MNSTHLPRVKFSTSLVKQRNKKTEPFAPDNARQPISEAQEKENLAASREMIILNNMQAGMSREEAEAQANELLAQPQAQAPKKD